jgi:insulysin
LLTNKGDDRRYRYLELTNGLRAMVVQDHNCDHAAVAATIGNGHFNDPPDSPGLSHLLEHMLFQGNSRFPCPDAFSDFLSLHSGYLNAATGSEYSHYYFCVSDDKLPLCLEHFAAMLTQPLFKQHAIIGEIEAIEAEFSLKIKDDLRRLYQVHKETSNPAHPFSKFSVGNKQSLTGQTLQELQSRLKKMHQARYFPGNICICIISQHSLDASIKILEQHFSGLASGAEPTLTPYPQLYLPQQLGVKINIQPLTDTRRLIVTFSLPNVQSYYRGKPVGLISDLIGDEGAGSLLTYLKQQNLVTNLTAGGGIEGSNFRNFNINLQLTENGADHINIILNALFYFIQLIKQQDDLDWRFVEKQKLNQLIWNYADGIKPIDDAIGIANAMFLYPPEHVLAGEYILDKPDSDRVIKLLAYFTPTNMRIKLIQPNVKTDTKAKWYDTPYSIAPLDQALLSALKNPQPVPALALPQANPYLTLAHKQFPVNSAYTLPRKIIRTNQVDAWYGQDDKFNQPRGDCYVSFDCAATTQGVEIATLKRLWIALLNEALHRKYYQANVAGLHFHLYSHQCGFSLHTSGFSPKQLDFCADLIKQIEAFDSFEPYFEQIKQLQWQSLRNNLLNKPINRLFSRLSVLMQPHTHTPLSMSGIMQQADLNQLRTTKHALFSSFHMDILSYGNWRLPDARQFSADITTFASQYSVNKRLSRGVLNLSNIPTQLHQLNGDHPETEAAVVVYYQAPSASCRDTILSILTEQILAPAFFNYARQQQKLGYLVGSGYVPYNQHPGISLYIQSPKYSAQKIIAAIHTFIRQFAANLSLYADDWQDLKFGVMKQLTAKDTNLSMKSQRLWSAIGTEDHQFQLDQIMLAELALLNFIDLQQFITKMSTKTSFGELILYSDQSYVPANEINAEALNDIDLFKKQAYPPC